MTTKTKTITLSFPHYDDTKNMNTSPTRSDAPRVYRVEKVTDSTEFEPTRQLSKKQVDELCDAKDWKVTVVPAT
jgi:hypothetical protein